MSDPMTDLAIDCLADADRELREARRENAELRAENARLRDLLWRCHVAFEAHHTRHHVLAMHAGGRVCPVCETSGLLAEIDRESGEGDGP